MKRNPNLKPLYFIEGLWDLQGHEYKPYRKSPFPLAGQMFFSWNMYKDTLVGSTQYSGKRDISNVITYGYRHNKIYTNHFKTHTRPFGLTVTYQNGIFINTSPKIRETFIPNHDKTIIESLCETTDDGINWYTWKHIVYTRAHKPIKEFADHVIRYK